MATESGRDSDSDRESVIEKKPNGSVKPKTKLSDANMLFLTLKSFLDGCAGRGNEYLSQTEADSMINALKEASNKENPIEAMKQAFRLFLKKIASDKKLLSYFALCIAEEGGLANVFFGRNESLKLNAHIVPDLYDFNTSSHKRLADNKSLILSSDDAARFGYLNRGYTSFRKVNPSLKTPSSYPTRQGRDEEPFWLTDYAKEPREQLKVALLDLSTPTNVQLASGRSLQALKNDIYDIVFQYKENIEAQVPGLEQQA